MTSSREARKKERMYFTQKKARRADKRYKEHLKPHMHVTAGKHKKIIKRGIYVHKQTIPYFSDKKMRNTQILSA